jgi:hypothetical protein
MGTRSKVADSEQERALLRRKLTAKEQERLGNDAVYQRVRKLHEEMKRNYGVVAESWPLIREDRER